MAAQERIEVRSMLPFREGLQVGQYYMFDAAIPSEAIDETLRAESREDEAFAKYVPSAWRDYTNACWAANWHRFFKNDLTDARGKMGWANRFQDALANATEVFNYYSSGDEVFHETANPPWLLAGLDESWANYCWQKQETLKGSRLPAGTAYGGWRFHIWTTTIWNDGEQRWDGVITNYTPAAVAAMVADGSITNNPVFNRGFSPMFDCNASLDDQWLALAKYVPAVSSPVGGRAVVRNVGENVNMNLDAAIGGVPRPNGWGRNAEQDGSQPWLHSDMKDVAFFYVYKLYEQLITKGNLK